MSKKTVAGIYAIIGLCLLATSAFAVNMNNAGWYFHVDLKNLENGHFSALFEDFKDENDEDDFESELNLILGKELREQIERITIYGGQAGYNDFTILAEGNFSRSAKSTFFDKVKKGSNYSTSKIVKTLVHQWIFDGYESDETDSDGDSKINISMDDEEDEPLVLFSAEVDSKMLIVSRDKDEVASWLNGSYNKKDLAQKGVFSVVVHLDRTIAHGGLNFGDEDGNMDFGFDSKLMQKISQFSFSVREEKKDALIEMGLVTKDEKMAMQLKNVVNGFIALASMAGDMDEDIAALVSDLSIEVDGVNLLLKTTLSTEQLKVMAE